MNACYAPHTAKLLAALPQITRTDETSLWEAGFDSLKILFMPEAVIRPETPEPISEVLRLANAGGVPVTVRGAGTTLTGSATPVRGGWVLDLSALNAITIDAAHRMATVQCGAVVNTIQEKAAAQGLFYPPDPSSHRWCTIGGTIACNAGGLRCVKYGVTRDYVVALRGFLPTGEAVEWGKAVKKFATGYNIRDLWIGSEGTLGVITEAVLKLIPRPHMRRTVLVAYPSDTLALQSALQLLTTGVTPSILEFIDTLSVRGAEATVGEAFFPGKGEYAVVLVEVDGDEAAVERDFATVLEWASREGLQHRVARDEQDAESLWVVRRKCSGAMYELGPSKLNEDTVVPLAAMPALMEHIHELREQYQLPIAVFGHAGDGNLHVNIMYDRKDPKRSATAEHCLHSVMERVVALGGAISGEHGVGLAKSHYIGMQFDAVQLGVMQAIKKTFDPKGILNPGKIFEPFSPWEYERVHHAFPWDHR
jgi:glycolate oxidase